MVAHAQGFDGAVQAQRGRERLERRALGPVARDLERRRAALADARERAQQVVDPLALVQASHGDDPRGAVRTGPRPEALGVDGVGRVRRRARGASAASRRPRSSLTGTPGPRARTRAGKRALRGPMVAVTKVLRCSEMTTGTPPRPTTSPAKPLRYTCAWITSGADPPATSRR